MVYDDIIIGSGLSALATVIGLPKGRRTLVIGGSEPGSLRYYDSPIKVPNAYLGFGGLGNFWHGVIPMRNAPGSPDTNEQAFSTLFRYFYPRTELVERIGTARVFVPRRAIRPVPEWKRLIEQRAADVTLAKQFARGIDVSGNGVTVTTDDAKVSAKRLWLAAGVLNTPALLADVFGNSIVKGNVSDHVICYLGQIDRSRFPQVAPPEIERVAEGMWYGVEHGKSGNSLISRKPARFAYRTLDHAIEERAVFGLPTASAISKILGKASPGLLAEALFNRYGLFPSSRMQSVYGQILVPEAYSFAFQTGQLTADAARIGQAIESVHKDLNGVELTHSARRDLFLPGIHLHNSLDASAFERFDLNKPDSSVQIVDASAHADVGPEHHSFKMMVSAFARPARAGG